MVTIANGRRVCGKRKSYVEALKNPNGELHQRDEYVAFPIEMNGRRICLRNGRLPSYAEAIIAMESSNRTYEVGCALIGNTWTYVWIPTANVTSREAMTSRVYWMKN